jgi:hypothetical protein
MAGDGYSSQQAAASASFNSEHSALFAGFFDWPINCYV